MMDYLEIDPAKAKSKLPPWDDETFIAEEKLDGWRFLMHFGCKLDRVYMTGRRISKVTGRLSEKAECAVPLWPSTWSHHNYTVIDGEVMSPTGFNDIPGIMNVHPDSSARRIAEIGPPRYVAFDILFFDGVDIREIPGTKRRLLLEKLVPTLENDLITVVERRPDTRKFYDEIVKKGGEGVVLKHIYSAYGDSGSWIKVKKIDTLDVIVTGFKPGKGKYAGQIGAAIVSVYSDGGPDPTLIEVGNVSGMTDDTRLHMSNYPEDWIDTVVEIEAQGFAKNRLRHPRYKRRRPDVSTMTCTMTKIRG